MSSFGSPAPTGRTNSIAPNDCSVSQAGDDGTSDGWIVCRLDHFKRSLAASDWCCDSVVAVLASQSLIPPLFSSNRYLFVGLEPYAEHFGIDKLGLWSKGLGSRRARGAYSGKPQVKSKPREPGPCIGFLLLV
jgi:hypothetical protein